MPRTTSSLAVALILLTGCDRGPDADAPAAPVGTAPAAMQDEPPAPAATPTTATEQNENAMTEPPTETPPAIELRNRLADETSPYLLQHEANPVHWFPWGPEAFEAARALGRPIFLSVGYSTCYWCHVMERESFENEQIAAIMNEHFICIKVDREERPDVDDIYMRAVQMLNQGHGGWPMSVFLEPGGLRPFIGGTYFPPTDQAGRPGFPTVLEQVAAFWRDRRQDVVQQATMVADAVRQQMAVEFAPQEIGRDEIARAQGQLMSMYDQQDAGFVVAQQRRPKFPIPSALDFLMSTAWDVESNRKAVIHTLDRMATGGMYDQVGGGFHRYSTDEKWLVPHFEKMLYDNGQLASTYAEAYQRTGDAFYAQIIRETLDYVIREMTSPEGGFYSAQDAEVNHREGQNYLWQPGEVRKALSEAGREDLVDLALEVYGFNNGTNFQDPHHPEDEATNVVYLVERPDVMAGRLDLALEEFESRLVAINEIL
ncbi:MAG: thioredoxin domain-containing protein, partial [Planctomycetota bacterium]